MSELSEDPAERARKYIENFEKSIQKLNAVKEHSSVRMEDVRRISDAIHRYLEDADYYLKHGKPTTSLASIAYAEGLLDALAFLGLTDSKSTAQPI